MLVVLVIGLIAILIYVCLLVVLHTGRSAEYRADATVSAAPTDLIDSGDPSGAVVAVVVLE